MAFSSLLTSLYILALLCITVPSSGLAKTDADQRKAATHSDVYYMTEMADRFVSFTNRHADTADSGFLGEQGRLESAIRDAHTSTDKSLLEDAAVSNEESRIETQNAFNEMRNFVTTLKYAMGATGSATSCEELTCGERAYCTLNENSVAACLCDEGYEGNGFVCKSPLSFRSHLLLNAQTNESPPQVADVHVAAIGAGHVGVVYRDISQGNAGYIMLGKMEPSRIQWGTPVSFSNGSQAFGPVLASIGGGQVAVAFRDDDRGGDGQLAAGSIVELAQEGAAPASTVVFTKPKAFARNQAQAMAMLPLPNSHVAILFAEHVAATGASSGATYGTGIVAQIPRDGSSPEVVGKHRFTSGPVARLSATLLAKDHFVVSFRQGENGRSKQKAEASVMHAQFRGQDLIFDANPLLLEPTQTQIWARSVAPIQANTFAYTYHSGNEQATKQAILTIDPATRRLKMLQEPKVIAKGFSPYVGTISAAFMQQDATELKLLQQKAPRLLSFFAREDAGVGSVSSGSLARLCKVDDHGVPANCREVDLTNVDMASASGTPVGDGRVLLVFTDSRGSPRYQLMGLLDPE